MSAAEIRRDMEALRLTVYESDTELLRQILAELREIRAVLAPQIQAAG